MSEWVGVRVCEWVGVWVCGWVSLRVSELEVRVVRLRLSAACSAWRPQGSEGKANGGSGTQEGNENHPLKGLCCHTFYVPGCHSSLGEARSVFAVLAAHFMCPDVIRPWERRDRQSSPMLSSPALSKFLVLNVPKIPSTTKPSDCISNT